MTIVDAQGRLFGRINLLDIAVALLILLVIIGIFFVPGTSGTSVGGTGNTQPIEVDAMVRGLRVGDPDAFVQTLEEAGKTNVIIRNQPFGELAIKALQRTPRSVAVPQPDGSVKALPDPRPELDRTIDIIITLGGQAQITPSGAVLGNNKVKIGTPLKLEGLTYSINTSVIDVRQTS